MPENPGPADIFDPEADGYDPKTLTELVAAGRLAAEAAKELLSALHGCRTPLNLNPAAVAAKHAADSLTALSRDLAKAEELIRSETPLAAGFPDEDSPWTETRSPALSPRQMIRLAKDARNLNPGQTTTYLRVLQEHQPLPTLIRAKRWQENSARYASLIEELLADIESRGCNTCRAAAGEPCSSAAGNQAAPHAARRAASPLAAQHPREAAKARRVDPKYRAGK